jgi:type IX secretion system PorP/SprF family membrane protein
VNYRSIEPLSVKFDQILIPLHTYYPSAPRLLQSWQDFGSIKFVPKRLFMSKNYLFIGLLCSLGVLPVFGQQDPMFTKYQFNSLVFNPAYAGSNEHLTINAIHRQQWLGFDGAPVTQTLSAHTPLKGERVGLGFSALHDKIGPTETIHFAGAYAYRMQVGKKKNMKLSLGLQASIANWHGDWLNITVEQGTDPAFQQSVTRWLPNFGAGAYLYGKKFYLGLGCPQLLEHRLREQESESIDFYGKTYRHWYTSVGYVLPLQGDQIIFRPSVLLKTVGLFSSANKDGQPQKIGAPTGLNIDASLFFRQLFWIGTTYRTSLQSQKSSSDSVDFWVSWHFRNGLRLGAAYDITLSRLQKAAGNSFELMAGYEFDIKVKQVASPRYF